MKNMTFKELSDLWKTHKSRLVKTSTNSAYSLILKNHLLPVFENREISDIKNRNLQELSETLFDKNLSSRSVRDVILVIKMILNYGMELEMIPYAKFKIRYPSTSTDESKKMEVYNLHEQQRIVKYINENISPFNVAILITMFTGMRIGEICALQWKNVDLDNKIIQVRNTLQRTYVESNDGKWNTKLITGTPKSKDSNRDIPILNLLMPVLKAYSKVVNQDYYVVTNMRKPMEPRVMRNNYFRLILEEIKVGRRIKFHGLRHTFATRMVESGIDVKTISSILGHADVSITMNLYVHPSNDTKAASINKTFGKMGKGAESKLENVNISTNRCKKNNI